MASLMRIAIWAIALGSVSTLLEARQTQRYRLRRRADREVDSIEEDPVPQCMSEESLANTTWLRREQSGEANVCIKGKLVPQLYVIGSSYAKNSLVTAMVGAGAECAGFKKEFNYWDRGNLAAYRENASRAMDAWLEELPWCGESAVRRVAADFTTKYMSWVPKPSGTLEEGLIARLPWVLATMYGIFGKYVTFVVMMRNPLSSMYAVWHRNYQHLDLKVWANDQMNKTTKVVWRGMFGFQMSIWTSLFRDRQFYMIPFRYLEGNSSRLICNDLSKKLNYAMTCGEVRRHYHDRPLPEQMKEFFGTSPYDITLAADKDLLLDNLQRGSHQGMGLAAYDGAAQDRTEIKAWLERGW